MSESEYGEQAWRDEDVLRELYHEEGLTQVEIGDKLGCCDNTISRWFGEYDIVKPWRDEDLLQELYVENEMSTYEIGDRLGCSHSTIQQLLCDYGIDIRSKSDAVHIAVNNDGTKGVYWHIGNRYEKVKVGREGPYATTVAIHRFTAYARSGIEFDEFCDSVTHHKNRMPLDNRPQNLEFMSNEEHADLHSNNPDYWRDEPTSHLSEGNDPSPPSAEKASV